MTFGQFYCAVLNRLRGRDERFSDPAKWVGERPELIDVIYTSWEGYKSRNIIVPNGVNGFYAPDFTTIETANAVFNDDEIHGVPPLRLSRSPIRR